MSQPRTVYLIPATKRTNLRADLVRPCRHLLARWEGELATLTATYSARQADLQAEYLERLETLTGHIARLREVMGG